MNTAPLIVAVVAEKGGVGKTTLSLTLAGRRSKPGGKFVLGIDFIVIDTPPHSSADATEAARRAGLVLAPVEPHLFTLETLPKLDAVGRPKVA